jgi:DNA invertase Pin-like site-specific DNA recombinase
MRVKYIRVSTTDQNTLRQEQTKEVDKMYIDRISGITPFADRTEGKKLLDDVRTGNITEVVVHSLDRLGRNLIDILNTIEILNECKTDLYIESMGIHSLTPNGKVNSTFKLIASVLGSVSELERENIAERTREGIAIAKLQGKYVGRQVGYVESKEKFLSKHTDVKNYLNKHLTVREIAAITRKSTKTVQKVKNLLNVA